MGTNHISVEIFESPSKAPDYKANGEGFKYAELDKVLIVKNGTERGRPTLDLQFHDQDGNKYVAMITAQILKAIHETLLGAEKF